LLIAQYKLPHVREGTVDDFVCLSDMPRT